jgi:hypothetical protein
MLLSSVRFHVPALQVDVRDYWKPGGHRPMDQPLVDRTLAVLDIALSMTRSSQSTVAQLRAVSGVDAKKGDFVSGPSAVTAGIEHLLGPLSASQEVECDRMILKVVRDRIGSKETHCEGCGHPARCRSLAAWSDSP